MTIKELRTLRKNMPQGYAEELQKRLAAKGKEHTLIYIYQNLSGYRTNDDIIYEAVLLAKETADKKEERAQIMESLKINVK